jgi:hypothetical protein
MGNEFPKLRQILGAIFSIEVGLSDEAQAAMFSRALQDDEFRLAFENELCAAKANTQISWLDLLSNSSYEVDSAETEEEARAIVLDLLEKRPPL